MISVNTVWNNGMGIMFGNIGMIVVMIIVMTIMIAKITTRIIKFLRT